MATTDFWSWALARWGEPGVDGQLLALQDDHNLVVLEVLLAVWLAEQGVSAEKSQWQALQAAARPWVDEVVVPLRAQRRAWKGAGEHPLLHPRLARIELAAERELAAIYLQSIQDLGLTGVDSDDGGNQQAEKRAAALSHNLALATSQAAPPVDVVVTSRIAELLGPDEVSGTSMY